MRLGCCTVVLKGKSLWLQDSKSWPRFYMYIYFQTKAAPPYVRGWKCVQDAHRPLRVCNRRHIGFHVCFGIRMPKVLRAVTSDQFHGSIPRLNTKQSSKPSERENIDAPAFVHRDLAFRSKLELWTTSKGPPPKYRSCPPHPRDIYDNISYHGTP